ncbi:MAG: B12-binding domain-containing radical SAM protein, partial [Chloroflexi bacterium]|nr:B12-binding domain-containing radical SAM protein [Chloroflexota bacterium]
MYRHTGHNEISLLSLSTSDYPRVDELMRRMQEEFRPLGVSVTLPSLRVGEQLRMVGQWLNTDRH